MSLMAWFLFLSLLSVSLVSVAAAALMSRFVTERMLMLDVKLTTEFVNHMFQFERAEGELVKVQPVGHSSKVRLFPYSLQSTVHLVALLVFTLRRCDGSA